MIQCLQNLDLSLESVPVLDLGASDHLDSSSLAAIVVSGSSYFTVRALAKLLYKNAIVC